VQPENEGWKELEQWLSNGCHLAHYGRNF